jgi:dihydropteroate synthase
MGSPTLVVRGLELRFGARTYVMGIVNVTPDSFSGDGLLPGAVVVDRAGTPIDRAPSPVERAAAQAERMVAEGADILDVGGESTRPGHEPVDEAEELERVIGVVRAIRARLPDVPISVDTSKPGVAEAALAAGADILNDVTAVTSSAALDSLAATYGVPYILMHGRERTEYRDVVTDVRADLARAMDRATAAGCRHEQLIIDPGFGFGKTPGQNLELLSRLGELRDLGRPVLLGASRKSTIGHVLGLPVEDRLEGTLATTALAVAAGVDIVRVHDVQANVRVARMSDAIVRGHGRD